MIQTYLRKEQQAQFSAIAKALGITEYQLLKLIVLEFLKQPSFFLTQIQISLKKPIKV